MPRTCSLCERPDREAIDRLLVSKLPLRQIAAQTGGVTISALSRHHRAHVSAALAAIRAEVVKEQRPLIERIEELVGKVEDILSASQQTGRVSQALAAVRELRSLFELVGKVTGELQPEQQTVVNVMTHPQFLQAVGLVYEELSAMPEVRSRIAERMQELSLAE